MAQESTFDREATATSGRRTGNPLQQWKAIAIITLICVLGALAWSVLASNNYAATATGIVVAQGGDTDVSSALDRTELEYKSATSYESLAVSKPVAEIVIDTLDLDVSPEELLENVSANSPDLTPEIHVTTMADRPELTQELADAWIIALAEKVRQLEGIGASEAGSSVLVSVEPFGSASVPDAPSSSGTLLNLVLGVLVGLTLGFAYAYIRNETAVKK